MLQGRSATTVGDLKRYELNLVPRDSLRPRSKSESAVSVAAAREQGQRNKEEQVTMVIQYIYTLLFFKQLIVM